MKIKNRKSFIYLSGFLFGERQFQTRYKFPKGEQTKIWTIDVSY